MASSASVRPPAQATQNTGVVGFGFAILAYLAFHASFGLFAIFTGGYLPELSINHGGLGLGFGAALAVNVGLVLSFGVHHSLMARGSAKRVLTRYLPAPLERSSFVLGAAALLTAVALCWQPMPSVLWTVEVPAVSVGLWGLHVAGILLIVASTFAFDHAHLFGLKQAWYAMRGEDVREPELATPRLYRHVRHPMQLGVLVFLWAAPQMTVSRLVLSLGMTGYVLVGLYFEERDLIRRFGQRYLTYRSHVPKLIPRITAATPEDVQ